MIRSMYDWTMRLSASPRAMWALAAVSFIESSVFPIPPDVLLIPMIIARPHLAFRLAAVCTLASVAGGMLGYFIGYALLETVGQPVLRFYGMEAQFAEFAQRYNDIGIWAVLVAGITPFPYKVITILSGTTGMNLALFTLASIVARATRFFLVAALLWKFGPPIRDFIERRLGLVFTLSMALLIGGFYAVKYL